MNIDPTVTAAELVPGDIIVCDTWDGEITAVEVDSTRPGGGTYGFDRLTMLRVSYTITRSEGLTPVGTECDIVISDNGVIGQQGVIRAGAR